MTGKMKLTAFAMATLAGALVATTALADRGQGMERGMGPGPFSEITFAEIDADKDGKVTEAELTAWHTARAKALDTDGDGFVSSDELAARQVKDMQDRAKERGTRMISRLDTDGDGKLSTDELAARPMPKGLIDRVDTDKDGAVSQAEFDAAKERMAERGKGFMKKHGRGHGRGHDNN